jgi:aspartyl-tRNA(Asn)/glutamyl-tRNA(Gln) amidotransferase subunit C
VTTPPQPLTAKDVAKVGLLARLALSESDLERMTVELSKIVGFVSMLGELDTSDVAPLAHPLDTQNVFRDDVPAASLSTAEALQSAPRHDGACFLVPPVLGDSGAA